MNQFILTLTLTENTNKIQWKYSRQFTNVKDCCQMKIVLIKFIVWFQECLECVRFGKK